MNFKSPLSILLLAVAVPIASAQQSAPLTNAAAARPAFDAITIKPVDPNGGGDGRMGFFALPGGRVHMGYSSVKTLLYFAYGVKDFQIAGGPDWIGHDQYTIEAVPPDSSPSRQQKLSPYKIAPTEEQKQMLQSLLADRFAFKSHLESREGFVYILSRGTGKLELHEPKDKDADMRGGVTVKSGGIVDGEAHGINVTMAFLASQLTQLLRIPVVDQTGIAGNYDYDLAPVDPENHTMEDGIFDAMHRLGLNLKRGKGPIPTLVIDHIEKPTEN